MLFNSFPQQNFNNIKAFFMDMDGVLTDGSVYTFENEQIRKMNIKDGYAIQLAVKKGYHVVVISGGKSKGAYNRLKLLGIEYVYFGVSNKFEVYDMIKTKLLLKDSDIMYFGDDMPDAEVMSKVAISVAPKDASDDILSIASVVTQAKGGEGCVREMIEKVLKSQNNWYSSEALIW